MRRTMAPDVVVQSQCGGNDQAPCSNLRQVSAIPGHRGLVRSLRCGSSMRIITGFVLGALLCGSGPAEAAGTYGLFELRLGTHVQEGAGLIGGASLGLTLRPRGSPVLFVPMVHVDGLHQPSMGGASLSVQRSALDLTGSFRCVFPLVPRVRIYGELGGGASFPFNRISVSGLALREAGRLPVGVVGGGVKLRPSQPLSVGGRVLYRWTGQDLVSALRREGHSHSWQVSVMVGFHF